jgi:molybdate transport system substrate-binding protein
MLVLLGLLLPLAAAAQQLTVSAAASLTDAFKSIGSSFEESNAGVTIRFNFAASGVLVQQIIQGAPADVFASADQESMDRGVARGVVDAASRSNFASNSLVLIEPGMQGSGLTALRDLNRAGIKRIAIGAPETVPVGRYAKQVLENAELWSTLQPKLVQANSVRQVLDYVARGEVQAGFVYRTDASLLGDKVKLVLTTTGHEPIAYPAAVVSDSKRAQQARAFVDFLMSSTAQAVLARYGFSPP